MDKQSNQQQKDAGRKAHFIDTHVFQYVTDVVFKAMVDGTVYFTKAEQQESMRIVGGQYRDGKFLNL